MILSRLQAQSLKRLPDVVRMSWPGDFTAGHQQKIAHIRELQNFARNLEPESLGILGLKEVLAHEVQRFVIVA